MRPLGGRIPKLTYSLRSGCTFNKVDTHGLRIIEHLWNEIILFVHYITTILQTIWWSNSILVNLLCKVSTSIVFLTSNKLFHIRLKCGLIYCWIKEFSGLLNARIKDQKLNIKYFKHSMCDHEQKPLKY